MRVLVVGAGGVGSAAAAIAARRSFFTHFVIADFDLARAQRAALDERFVAARVDASNISDISELCRKHEITHVLNAVDPRFVMPVFEGALAAGADYLDMAMSLSKPHPDAPYERTRPKLGGDQFAMAAQGGTAGRRAPRRDGVGARRSPRLAPPPP